MDVLSHGLLPAGIVTYMRRPRAERWAAAIGGIAPDVDTLWAWTSGLDPELYFLAHRGFSHTIWGAPLLAFLVWFLLTRPWLRQRWSRVSEFRFERGMVPALLLGAWMHIALDNLTITGTPSLWPLTNQRYTLGLFFYSVTTMFLVSIVVWWRAWRRPDPERTIRIGTAVALAFMLLSGVVRASTYPSDLPDHAKVTPGFNEWSWFVSERNDTGVFVQVSDWGRAHDRFHFPEPNRTQAAAALRACESLVEFTAWRWNAWGLPITNSSARADGGWNVTFYDSVQLHAVVAPPFSLLRSIRDRDDYEGFQCIVDASGRARVDVQPGFWGPR